MLLPRFVSSSQKYFCETLIKLLCKYHSIYFEKTSYGPSNVLEP
jgi:hypothetical protein